jgi:hypothetical protein
MKLREKQTKQKKNKEKVNRMSEENTELTAVIKSDIRNLVNKLVFWTNFMGSDPAKRTKEITLRAFRKISQAGTLILILSAPETHVVHSMQELFVQEKEINEIEIIAESSSDYEFAISTTNFQIKKPATTTVATLKLPRVKIFSITPTKGEENHLLYLVTFKYGVGSSLVSY